MNIQINNLSTIVKSNNPVYCFEKEIMVKVHNLFFESKYKDAIQNIVQISLSKNTINNSHTASYINDSYIRKRLSS